MSVELAPCPFCGSADELELIGDEGLPAVHVYCGACFCAGPEAILGCRDPDEPEDGPIDLDAEATALWNQRYQPVTVEEIYDLAPQLEKSLAELEKIDPDVRAARERLDTAVGGIRLQADSLRASLTPKEREILDARLARRQEK